ncbi:MAG: GntR family transcriptional regulator [Candidatus Izemoplasmatales bacterium]|jgi:GntR family transcriptional regulator
MSIDIVIDHASEIPIYKQIAEQYAYAILNGKLSAHTMLPSIRSIALDLKISVITTKKAYEELEDLKLIYTISGKGCFVSRIDHEQIVSIHQDYAKDRIKKTLEYCKSLGLSTLDVINILKDIDPNN